MTLDSKGRSRSLPSACSLSPFSSRSWLGHFRPGSGLWARWSSPISPSARFSRSPMQSSWRSNLRVGARSSSNGLGNGRRLGPSAAVLWRLPSSLASLMHGCIRSIGCASVTAATASQWFHRTKGRQSRKRRVPGTSRRRLPTRAKGLCQLIVATAGGGIRAAYWTATVLEHLEEDFEIEGGSVRPYLFAISGVSGGSVGATAFEAALTQRDENRCTPDKPGDTAGKSGDKACPLATDFLKEDFLAPALASLVFQDAPSSFLPDFGQGDRGTALERSFEHASNNLLARPFLDLISFTEGGSRTEGRAALASDPSAQRHA